MKHEYEEINRRVMEMQGEILESIRESIAIRSVKGAPAPGAPYGEGPKQALEHALKLGEKLGFRTGSMADRVGWVEYGEGEEMAAVLGHLDVVPEGDGWTYPPFGGEIHDGKMYGRGVLDDKGPVIGAIYGLKAIRDAGLKPDRRIRVIFGTDEENGSSCVKYYVENGGELPTIGFTPDADYPLIFCEKGQLGWTVVRDRKRTDDDNCREHRPAAKLLRLEGGTARNVVTPHCVLEVEGTLKVTPGDGISVREEDGKTTVMAIGKGAHGSTPEQGINAAKKLFQAVVDADLDEDLKRMIRFVLEKIGDETNGASLESVIRMRRRRDDGESRDCPWDAGGDQRDAGYPLSEECGPGTDDCEYKGRGGGVRSGGQAGVPGPAAVSSEGFGAGPEADDSLPGRDGYRRRTAGHRRGNLCKDI